MQHPDFVESRGVSLQEEHGCDEHMAEVCSHQAQQAPREGREELKAMDVDAVGSQG